MAKKKELYTSSSKENILNMLNTLRNAAYSPDTLADSSNSLITEYDRGNIIRDLPVENLPEPVKKQQEEVEEEGFFTKLGNFIEENTSNQNWDYVNPTYFALDKPLKKESFKAALDPTFAVGEGMLQTKIDAAAGDMLLLNKEMDDLAYQKEFLETQKEMGDVGLKLNQARLEGDSETVKELAPIYQALEQAYLSGFDSYREAASKSEYYDKYGKQKTVRERLMAINQRLDEIKTEREEAGKDLQDQRNNLRKIQSIYKISPEYKKLEQSNWMYQVPRGMGSSFSSVGATAASFAATAGANFVASQAIAGTGGLYGELIAGGAAIVGAGATVAANIYSRNQESLAEVASNYKSNIQKYAEENGINIDAIASAGRKKLRELTGEEYSEDVNSQSYRSNEEVFEDMLTYDIATNNSDIDRLTATTKNNLKKIYNNNMALAALDIAQAAIVIPGAGKMFSNLLGKLNLAERSINATVKGLDYVIDKTIANVASKSTKKGIQKYVVDPAVRILANGGLEGVEEVTQYVIGSKINNQKQEDDINLYNPFDIGKLFIENQYYALKGIAAMAGVSGDPALDNDKELVDNFKVGMAIGILMGGGTQTYESIKNKKSYNAGRELARNTMTDYIQTKEDIYKYRQYAEKANSRFFDKDSFVDGLYTQLEEGSLPEGFTKEDIDAEKKNILDIYDIVNSKLIRSLNGQKRSIGAALLKHYQDRLKQAGDASYQVNSELEANFKKEVNDYLQKNNIPVEQQNAVALYLLDKARLEAYDDYAQTLNYFYEKSNNSKTRNAIDELYLRNARVKQELSELESEMKKDDSLKGVLDSPVLSTNIEDNLKKEAILQFARDIAYREALDNYNKARTTNGLSEMIDKYLSSQDKNKQFTNFTEPEDSQQIEPEQTTYSQDDPIQPEESSQEEVNVDEHQPESELDEQPVTQKIKFNPLLHNEPVPQPKRPVVNPTIVNDNEDSVINKNQEQDDDSKQNDSILLQANYGEQDESQPEIDGNIQPEPESESESQDDSDSISILERAMATEFDSDEYQDLRDDKLSEQDLKDGDINEIPVPQVDNVTFDNDLLSRSITQEDVDNTKIYESDTQIDVDDTENSLVNGTLFYQISDSPMKPGYESGIKLNEFVSTIGNIQKATFTAEVEPENYEYGKYRKDNKATWDNAAIRVIITDPDGKKYITSLKTIDGARSLYERLGKPFTKEVENNLRELRNKIISAKLENPDAIIKFKNVSMSNGKLNRSSENRKLTLIKGLHLPSNLRGITNSKSGFKFGIGKGIVGDFVIADKDGMPLPGHGGSGKIFIYPRPQDTLNGKSVPIQLNEERFVNNEQLANYLAKMFIYHQPEHDTLQYEDMMHLLLNYGEKSLIDPNDPRYEFLGKKLFYLNYKENWAQLGEERVSINSLRTDAGIDKVTRFIADNLHWNTEKQVLWKPIPESFKEHFKWVNNIKSKPSKELEILPGLKFDLEDLGLKIVNNKLVDDTENPKGLTVLEWMIKHGHLKTNLNDNIFTEPFIYVGEPIIEMPAPTKQNTESQQNNKPSLLESANYGEFTDDDYAKPQQTTEPEQQDLKYDPYTDSTSEEFNNFFGFEKRMPISETKESKKINTEKAVNWLKSKLGLYDSQIEVVEGVIEQFANGEAVYGITTADGIAISNMAIEGVQYHEAWHRVSLLLLDSKTRLNLYEEFKKQNPLLRTATDKKIEEAIADSFMDYMVNDKESKFRYFINKVFRNIKRILGFSRRFDKASLNDIFKDIKYGEFSKYRMNESSRKQFFNSYKNGAYYKVGPKHDVVLTHFPTVHDFESALDSLKSFLFIANGTRYISDISKLDNGKLKKLLQSYVKLDRLTSDQKEALNEIIEKFDVFMYHLQPKLEQMGIVMEGDFEEADATGITNYSKASYEFNKKDTALASVKMFIATLADTYFDENHKLTTKVNNLTGLPMIVDYDEAYSLILNNLSTVEEYSVDPNGNPENSLIGRCERLSNYNPFFAFLYRRLTDVKDSNLETQILQTIKSFNQNFVEVAYATDEKGKTSFSVRDTSNKGAVRMFPSTWSDMFFNSDLVVKTNTQTKVNEKAVKDVIEEFNKLSADALLNNLSNEDAQALVNRLVRVLNKVGINVDDITIEGLLNQTNRIESIRYLIANRQAGGLFHLFNGTIKSTLGGNQTYTVRGVHKVRSLDSIYLGLGKSNIINQLALSQAETHPDETNISALGPNNNIIYTKTQNCYVSDLLRWMNIGDEETMRNLNNDPYCRSSLLLNAANSHSNLKLNTFINFYGDKAGDKGRDYLSISPTEDYIAKMAFTFNNHIIFPTMADKKTWFTISGVKLFNDPIRYKIKNNNLYLKFNHNALAYYYRAWQDEYNAIVNYYNTLSSVKEPIKNYHTSGKGGLFRHFTGYYEVQNGENVWIDLNSAIKDALKYDKLNNTNTLRDVLENIKHDLFENPEATLNKINDTLMVELQQEMDTCESLGIIVRDSKNPKKINNKLLDENVLEYYKGIYSQADPLILANAERYAIITMIGNHMINQNISTIETEKIITGDEAFYKNGDDKIKRLGAVLSTGDNLRTQWLTNDPTKAELYKRLNGNTTYTCAIFNDNEIPSLQYDTIKELFRFDNVRNLLIEKENLSEAKVDELMKNEEEAKKKYPEVFALAEVLADEDAGAYGMNKKGTKGNINQADAAVYIRPEMYEQIVRRLGEWSPEVEEAFKILESDSNWLSDKELYAKSLKTLIKALKTTYFGYTYNADLGYNVPIFNKMAMFPMFKAIATGDNREIYDRMNAVGKYEGLNPIDQIAFESAVKVGIEGGHNFYTDYTNSSINDMTNIHTTTQYFRNLRRQLITDPHTHDRTLFGTQVSTVAVSNLVMDRVYGDENKPETLRTGEQLKQQLFGTINAISNKGMFKVEQQYMTDGELDMKKTSDALIKEAASSGMGKNMEDALSYNKDNDDFEVSLAALPDSKWVETKITSSVNKKSIDLELPGGAFIQMSSFGFKSIKAVGSSAVAGGKRLVNINPDGSMDAIISINLFRHVIPNFDKLSFTEAKQWLIDNHIIGDNAGPMALGYRIPTQGLSSIAGIRVKDVLPSNVGDMIVLPDEFTTQTGSDFDIDKLYIARYNYDKEGNKIEFKPLLKRVNDEGEIVEESFDTYLHRRFSEENQGVYEVSDRGEEAVIKLFNKWLNDIGNPTNVYEANSREANENLLLETYLTVLIDKKTVDQTRLPLDKVTGIIKNEILKIVDGPSSKVKSVPFNEISPTYQMNKKYEYSGGKTGIGPFALNNKNHILTQLANLKFAENKLLSKLGFTGLDGIKSRNESVFKRDEDGIIQRDSNGKPIVILEEGIRILDWISAMINAHVDVAKDPYVIRLNVRQYTYNICNFLLRVGYGKTTFYFLPQPILKDMAVAYDAYNGNYGVEGSSKNGIKEVREKYFDEYKNACAEAGESVELSMDNDGNVSFAEQFDYNLNDLAPEIMKRDNLIKSLEDGRNIESLSKEEKVKYYKNQLLVSQVFAELNELAQDMSKLVQLSQIDTKRFGNNFVELDRFLYRLKSLIVNTKLFKPEDIVNYYTDTFLYTKLQNGIIKPANMFESIMFRGNFGFKQAITKVLSMVGRIDSNDEALNKTISNELEGQLRQKFLASKDVDTFDMLYGDNSMAIRLSKIKSDILNGKYEGMLTQDGKISNKLLNSLNVLTRMSTDTYFAPSIITKNRISDGDKYLKQTLTTYWEELLDSPYEEIRSFANDLFYYQLATTAGNFTKNGIFNLTPIKLIKESGYNQFMRDLVKNFLGDYSLDYDDLFLNNWSNDKLVKPVKLYKEVFDRELNEYVKTPSFDILMSEHVEPSLGKVVPVAIMPKANAVGTNSESQFVYQPYLKVVFDRKKPSGTLLYKFVGFYEDSSKNTKPVYVLVQKKGLNDQGRVLKEYNHFSNSIVSENNTPLGMLAKKSELYDFTLHVLPKGLKILKDKWKEIFDNTNIVEDYVPTTKAMLIDFKDPYTYSRKEDNAQLNLQKPENAFVNESSTERIVDKSFEEPNKNNKSVFTFKDGMSVEIPFTLNEQLKELLYTLEDFVKHPENYNNSITISGYAGTGKTTMIGIFNKWLNENWITPIFSSPTHRANAVTKMNNPDAEVKTLHSIFGLSQFVDLDGKYDLRKMKNELINKPKIGANQILIIDEASMVSESLYKFIEDFKEANNIKVIYMGDSALLSPVKDTKISPVFRNNDSKIELTKVERTGDNPILAEATALREGKDLSFTTSLVNGEGVEYIPTGNDRVNQVINEIVASPQYKENPLYFRILSATNNMISDANDRVRKQLFGENAKQIEVGEILMGYDNINGKEEPLVRNSIDYVVTSVSDKKTKTIKLLNKKVELSGYETKIKMAADNESEEINVFILDNEIPMSTLHQIYEMDKALNIAISNAFKTREYNTANMLMSTQRQFKRETILMKSVEQEGRLLLRKSLDYGYAHTIHKSQGGTYNKVMIYLDTIGAFDSEVQQQLKYVAVSRAKENVYIVTKNKLNEQPIDKQTDNQADNKIAEQPTPEISYTLHSGGAIGADSIWGKIAESYGIKQNHYYYLEKTPVGNFEISKEDAIEGQQKVTIAARQMGRIEPTHQVRDIRLIRNWSQVKYSDAIFAVTTLLPKGKEMNYGKISKIIQGKGGTGYAMQMAINEGKPVYIFDQVRNQWYKNINGVWSKSDTPTLTKNFAGIGTREINAFGVQAIKNVFDKTFGDTNSSTAYDSVKQVNEKIVFDLGGGEIAKQEVKDAVSVAKKGISFEDSLSSVTPVFTKEEIQLIKQGLNGKPLRVMSVSRRTDPAFFAKDIIKFLEENSKKPFTDPTRVNAIELWTKHDGMPIRNILEACVKYKVAPMVSFSITTLGDTSLEKGVLKYQDLLPLIKGLIDEKVLDPRTTTVRIDPILVGATNMDDVKAVVQECKKMGITKFVTSLVQSYGYLDGTKQDRKVTSGINNALAKEGKTYDWNKYYGYDKNGKINFKPKQEYINQIGEQLLELDKDPSIRIETCAFLIKGLKASACLDPLIIERITGVDVTRKDGTYNRDTSRPECMCYGCHGDMFKVNEKSCYSSCAYCYAAHSGDSPFNYYNEDGTIKDRPLTRYKTESKPQESAQVEKILYANDFNRASAILDKDTLYIFTDNTNRTSGGNRIDPNSKYAKKYGTNSRYPNRTQAVLRGLDNAMPISTQRYYSPGSDYTKNRWTDNDFEEFKKVIDSEINDIKAEWDTGKYKRIVIGGGNNGWFNSGIANISKERVPLLYKYLAKKEQELFDHVYGTVQPSTETNKQEPTSSDTINIYWGDNLNKELSNLAPRKFVQKKPDWGNTHAFVYITEAIGPNVSFASVESAFQAYKVLYSSNYITPDGELNGIGKRKFLEIARSDGSTARMLGKQLKGLDRNLWDADSYIIMKNAIQESIEQNPDVKKQLLDTGDAKLTHVQDKGKWGTDFQKALMEVREYFKENQNNATVDNSKSVVNAGQPSNSENLLEMADFGEFEEMRNEGKDIKNICNNGK